MKYSRLPPLELKKLEKDFIKFLIINGITAEDWEKMQEEPAKCDPIIDAFSDVIWEGVLQKTKFLIRQTPRVLYAFSFGIKSAQLIIAQSESQLDHLTEWRDHSDVKISFQEKQYRKQREREIFELIQQGCSIAEGDIYKSLAMKLDH